MGSQVGQSDAGERGPALWFYQLAIGEDEARLCRDIPEEQCHEQPRSFTLQVASQALGKTADVLADCKVVMPWLLGVVGAPAFAVGLLVPIRESLALLPQSLIGGMIRRFPVRKGLWVASSLVQGFCVIGMGAVGALGLRGDAAGAAIIGLLVVFSLARGVASIAGKDILGKTVSKGRRGRVGGYAATASGLAASGVGVLLMLNPSEGRADGLLYAMFFASGLVWFASGAIFSRIHEVPGATEGGIGIREVFEEQWAILTSDGELQKFLVARTLMLSTALVGPVYVGLAQREAGQSLVGLGWLIVASGLAGTVSSSFWGVLSDRSSRLTMALGAGLAGLLGVAVLASLSLVPEIASSIPFYACVLFVLNVAHAGVRIGRKTHAIDIAGGDRKAVYVALSNTIIGILMLFVGALVGVVLGFGLEIGLATLSAMGLLGGGMALRMGHAQE